MLFKRALALILVLFSGFVFAGNSQEVSLAGKKLQIISTGTPRVYIYDVTINDGCTNDTPVLIMGGINENPLAKELYSTLLMAKASGKKVLIQSKGCWAEWSTPIVTSMYVLD